ncbi:hypothetical protein Tco_1239341 [Tanacetum coccineum]
MEYDFDVSTAEGFTTSSAPITTAKLEISTTNILVSTAGAAVTTASASISTVSPLRVSTAEDISGAETLVYIRMSASKDKGKTIMTKLKPEQTTMKLQQRQERAGFKLDEREEVVAKVNQAHDIDWSDPAVLRYQAVQNRSFSIAEIEKEVMKRSRFDLQQESSKQVKEEIFQQDDVVAEQVVKESSRKAEGRLKRKTSKTREDKNNRQKMPDDPLKL